MGSRATQDESGFTLLEVLAAFVVLTVSMTALSLLVIRTAQQLGATRVDQTATRLGEQKIRELLAAAEAGELPKLGVEEGVFDRESPDDPGYAFRLEIEPYSVPTPEGVDPQRLQGSGLFAQGGRGGTPPAIRQVVLRVFPEDQESSVGLPFAVLLVEPGEAPAQGPGGSPTGEDANPGAADGIDPANLLQGGAR